MSFPAEFALRIAIGAAGTYVLGPVFSAPLWAVLLAKPIVELIAQLVRALRHAALQQWEGRYYAFDGRQVRVVDVSGTPWIVDLDVFASLGIERVAHARELLKRTFGMNEYARIAGTREWGFSEAGLRRYLANRQDTRTRKFGLWLEREVYFPWHRRNERSIHDIAAGTLQRRIPDSPTDGPPLGAAARESAKAR